MRCTGPSTTNLFNNYNTAIYLLKYIYFLLYMSKIFNLIAFGK